VKIVQGFIPGEPIAQPRHRVGVIGGHARMFEATKKHPIHAWKAQVRHELVALGITPYDGPMRASLMFWFARPGRLVWKKRPMMVEPHTSKPDVDNLAKAFMDAASGIVWNDDSQLYVADVAKHYVAGGGTPGLAFTLTYD